MKCTLSLSRPVTSPRGGDIASYDIYPVNGTHKDLKDKLWLVAVCPISLPQIPGHLGGQGV